MVPFHQYKEVNVAYCLSCLISSAASLIGQLPGKHCWVIFVHSAIVGVHPVQHRTYVVLVRLHCKADSNTSQLGNQD